MASRKRLALHASTLTLALGVAVSTPLSAAVETPVAVATASAPEDPLEELEEVWVRGKRLADRITDAEDDFFALYNKINKTNRFDVRCGYMSLTRDSMIMVRTCVPQFLANYSRGASGFTQRNTVPNFASTFDSYDGYGSSFRYSGRGYDMYGNNSYSYGGYGYVSGRNYAYAPPPDLMAMHYRQDYAKNVIDVIYSDPGLLEKAKGLAVLYTEMETMQGRYKELRKITRKMPVNDKVKARKAARRGFDRTGG